MSNSNNSRIVRRYSLNNSVLSCSCYDADEVYLRLNVNLDTGKFDLLFCDVDLSIFCTEVDIILKVCSKLIEDE